MLLRLREIRTPTKDTFYRETNAFQFCITIYKTPSVGKAMHIINFVLLFAYTHLLYFDVSILKYKSTRTHTHTLELSSSITHAERAFKFHPNRSLSMQTYTHTYLYISISIYFRPGVEKDGPCDKPLLPLFNSP